MVRHEIDHCAVWVKRLGLTRRYAPDDLVAAEGYVVDEIEVHGVADLAVVEVIAVGAVEIRADLDVGPGVEGPAPAAHHIFPGELSVVTSRGRHGRVVGAEGELRAAMFRYAFPAA